MLLCHCDGTDGAVTFADSTGRHSALTAFGLCTLTTAQQKFGTGSLNMPSSVNTGGGARSPSSADWQFGAGQFTVECWVRPIAAPFGVNGLVSVFGLSSNFGWFLGFNGGTLNFYYSLTGTDTPVVSATYVPTTNAWTHIAADRDASNVLRVYAAGAVIASATVPGTFFNSTQALNIGSDNNNNRAMLGQIDEVRITKGVARYAGAFTPPTAPFDDTGVTPVVARQYAVTVVS